ncbi:MAG: hypothetical protein P1P78_14755 [Methyloprofundus sp.]|nr:hypothetical protein [Methyloprofundus sp.]
MKLINIEPRNDYILRIYLDDNSVVDFDVKAELERIPCYKCNRQLNHTFSTA